MQWRISEALASLMWIRLSLACDLSGGFTVRILSLTQCQRKPSCRGTSFYRDHRLNDICRFKQHISVSCRSAQEAFPT